MANSYPKYFLQSNDKMVYISDGVDNFSTSLDIFQTIEPTYSVPLGATGLQYTEYGEENSTLGFWFAGNKQIDYNAKNVDWDKGQFYINSIKRYLNSVAKIDTDNDNPFLQVPDVATARKIAATLITNYFDKGPMSDALANTVLEKESATGATVFFLTLIEAAMFTLNKHTVTPLIDAQLLPNEDKSTTVQQIMATKGRFVWLAHEIKLKKTALLGLMASSITTVSDVIQYVNNQIGTTYPLPKDDQ